MTPYEEIVGAIVEKFVFILGKESATKEVLRVKGLTVTRSGTVKFSGQNQKAQLEALINRYRIAFGPAAIVFCRDVSGDVVTKHPDLDIPDIIRPTVKV